MRSSIYKISLLALAFLFAGFTAFAQDDDDWFGDEPDSEEKGKISGGVIHVPFGFMQTSKAGLNSSLDAAALPRLEDTDFSWGIDGTFFVRNFVIRIGATNTFQQEVQSTSQNFQYDLKLRELGLGYNLFSKKGFIVYPTAHIGRFKHTVVTSNSAPTADLQGTISGNYVGTEATQRGLYTGAGIGLDYMLGFDESSGSGITFGLHAGYNLQLTEAAWEAYGLFMGEGNGDDISSPYIRLSIGFSGWHRQ